MEDNNPYQKAGFASFDELYNAHHEEVRRLIRRRIANPDVVDDLVQTTFLGVIESIERFEEGRNMQSWIYKIAKCKAMDYLRKQYSQRYLNENINKNPPEVPTPEQVTINKELTDLVKSFLGEKASDSDLEILKLSAEGYKPREISKIIGVSDEVTRMRLHRTRKKINDYLSEL